MGLGAGWNIAGALRTRRRVPDIRGRWRSSDGWRLPVLTEQSPAPVGYGIASDDEDEPERSRTVFALAGPAVRRVAAVADVAVSTGARSRLGRIVSVAPVRESPTIRWRACTPPVERWQSRVVRDRRPTSIPSGVRVRRLPVHQVSSRCSMRALPDMVPPVTSAVVWPTVAEGMRPPGRKRRVELARHGWRSGQRARHLADRPDLGVFGRVGGRREADVRISDDTPGKGHELGTSSCMAGRRQQVPRPGGRLAWSGRPFPASATTTRVPRTGTASCSRRCIGSDRPSGPGHRVRHQGPPRHGQAFFVHSPCTAQ